MKKNLTIKQEKFALKYFECGNASEAYRYAYSAGKMKEGVINNKASLLLTKGAIRVRLKELRDKQQKRLELSADDIIKRLGQIILYDPLDIFYPNGKVRPLNEIPKELRILINGVKRKDVFGETSSEEVEYKIACKDKALVTLMKHLGMFEKTIKVEGEFSLKNILQEIEKEDD